MLMSKDVPENKVYGIPTTMKKRIAKVKRVQNTLLTTILFEKTH